MGITHGMNPNQVLAMGRQLQEQARLVEASVQSLGQLVTRAVWQGEIAAQFKGPWWSSHRQSLQVIADDLRGYGQSAINNANHQLRVSDDTAIVRGGIGTVSPQGATVGSALEIFMADHGLGGMTPAQMLEYLENHPELVDDLTNNPPREVAKFMQERLNGRTREEVRAAFSELDVRDQHLLAMTRPELIGNMHGAPFEVRATANHVQVVDELARERRDLNWIQHQDNELENNWQPFDGDNLDGDIAEAKDRIALYESILAGDAGKNRNIIVFDPDRGRIAEVHGDLESAQGVGVFVPGTGADMHNFQGQVNRSKGILAAGDEDVAMVTWLGADMPDSVPGGDAAFNQYAEGGGMKLAEFSHDLRQEMTALNSNADVSVYGHSYGGPVVGNAELHGLDADRVVHIQSAGSGAGVDSVQDYPVPDRERYFVQVSSDFINWTAGVNYGDHLGHGGDVSHMDGFEPLDHGAHSVQQAHSVILDDGKVMAELHRVVVGRGTHGPSMSVWEQRAKNTGLTVLDSLP